MYGVTESEKFHILPPIALLHGLLDNQRDEILRDHAKVRNHHLCLLRDRSINIEIIRMHLNMFKRINNVNEQ